MPKSAQPLELVSQSTIDLQKRKQASTALKTRGGADPKRLRHLSQCL